MRTGLDAMTSEAGVCVALVSGGLDSPVAVARMARAGWRIFPLHCSQEPVTGPEAEEKTAASIAHLANPGGPLGAAAQFIDSELRVVTVGTTLASFTDPRAHRDYFVHMKRLFNALANRLAAEVGATAILTGENLGQVSSQTLGNLGAVEAASDHPILRPLLGMDKEEIIVQSRELGTFEIAAGPEMCDALGPSHPTTVADLSRLLMNEAEKGGLEALADAAYASIRTRPLTPP